MCESSQGHLAAAAGTASAAESSCAAATRANLNCNFAISWISGAPGSASCLRMDPLYYQVSQRHAVRGRLQLACSFQRVLHVQTCLMLDIA